MPPPRKNNSESHIQAAIRAALSRDGNVRVWRNNTGVLPNGQGGFLRFGLAVGSGDLIGIVMPMGRFFSLEIKTPKGRISPEQYAWQATVRKFGGVAEFARSVEEALAVVHKIKTGEL